MSEENNFITALPQEESISGDNGALDLARTQWQFGDWNSLSIIQIESLLQHPERAKLALLVASSHLQTGKTSQARTFIELAIKWGIGKKLLGQILISGVHNSLARAAAITGQDTRAIKHFENAIHTSNPGMGRRLLIQARIGEQLRQLGMNETALNLAMHSANRGIPIVESEGNTKEGNVSTKQILKKVSKPNPYAHNRDLTSDLNEQLREFASQILGLKNIKSTYIDYLALKSIQIERNCVGRLATTVQDAITRQLVLECLPFSKVSILEIGALYGISLAILYNHAITRHAYVKIICLDPFDGYYGQAHDAVLNQPVNELSFIRNMHLANIPNSSYQIIKHYSTSPDALIEAKNLTCNLLIIDGDHSYDGVKFDFENYFKILEPGGYVIIDDYNAKEWPGIQKFVDEDLKKFPDFEFIGSFSRSAIGKKRKIQ